MVRSADAVAREATLVELKSLIRSRIYETQEKLEEAVDAFLCGEFDRQQSTEPTARELARVHPK